MRLTIRATAALPQEPGMEFAAFALGTLAGAAIHDWVTFSDDMLADASKCRSEETMLEIERRSYIERITA